MLVLFFTNLLTTYTAIGLSQDPRFNMVNRNVTFVAGSTAVLPCSVDYLGSYKIVWEDPRGKTLTLEDRRIISDDRFSVERPYVKEWNLHLRMVTPEDAGTYKCMINTNPTPQIRGIVLIVHEPPKILETSTPNVVTVREGNMVELFCNVAGNPFPNVTWYRAHTGLLDEEEVQGKKHVGQVGEVLVIHNVSRYCDDKYECEASNGVLPVATREIRVNVEFPPEVRLPNRRISQALGKTTILECEITANPLYVSVWRKDGKEIHRSSGGSGKYTPDMYSDSPTKVLLSLRIQALEEEDFGEYECYATNLLGIDSETMILSEYHRPETTTSTTTSWPDIVASAHQVDSLHTDTSSDTDKDSSEWQTKKEFLEHPRTSNLFRNQEGHEGINYPHNRYESEKEKASIFSNRKGGGQSLGSASARQLTAVLCLFWLIRIVMR